MSAPRWQPGAPGEGTRPGLDRTGEFARPICAAANVPPTAMISPKVTSPVIGRRSGREYTFPVGYRQTGDRVTIGVGWPERKLWWRNLRGGAAVSYVCARRAAHRPRQGSRRRELEGHRRGSARPTAVELGCVSGDSACAATARAARAASLRPLGACPDDTQLVFPGKNERPWTQAAYQSWRRRAFRRAT